MSSKRDGEEVWIYHERQDALLCGQHALNNLVQACIFSADGLAEIAQQLDQMELTYMAQGNEGGVSSKDYLKRVVEPSGNVDPSGNFSIEVLRSALMNQYSISLPNIQQEAVRSLEVTNMEGFVCNRESHWFAIRKINDRYWNLNSTKERPELISHFRLAAEIHALQDSGYSVFCVVDGLPPPCTTDEGRERGLPKFWWKEEDLLAGKGSSATTGATDPWKDVGSGMRLDGKPTRSNGVAAGGGIDHQNGIGDLTEEEMLQMAMAASLEPDSGGSSPGKKVELTPEPAPGEGVVRIQFRLPNGSRVVRRFKETDLVEMVYAFVEDQCPADGKRMECRAGFPPKDLEGKMGQTIVAAGLSGENVQVRHV